MKYISFICALCITPTVLYAASSSLIGFGPLIDFANDLASGVVTSLGYLLFSLAVVAFLWGMVQFIWAARNGENGDGMKNGKQFMLWGLISLFVMFSVFGIIIWAQTVFQVKDTTITIPNVKVLGVPTGNGGTAPSAGAGRGTGPQNCGVDATWDSVNKVCVLIGAGRGVGPQNCGPSKIWDSAKSICVANPSATDNGTPSGTPAPAADILCVNATPAQRAIGCCVKQVGGVSKIIVGKPDSVGSCQ